MNAPRLQFVVLRHDLPPGQGRGPHWDLMFQHDDRLRTWAVAELPQPGGTPTAGRWLPPHRLAYLDYEGPVSGNRGRVRRFDRGPMRWISDTPQRAVIDVQGQRLCGRLILQRASESSSVECEAVWMIWLSDPAACVYEAS